MHVLTENKRQRLREKKNRSIFVDFFFASPHESYRLVRVLLSLPIGIGLAYGYWYFLLSERDLGEKELRIIFQWFFIGIIGILFAVEPTVKSTMVLCLALVLSSQGQTLVSTYITERLMDGPIENMLKNFEKASLSLICNLNLAAQVAHARMQLMYEPIRDLAIDLGAGSAETERAIRNLDKIFDPVFKETEDDSETVDLSQSSGRMSRIIKIAEKTGQKKHSLPKPSSTSEKQSRNLSAFLNNFDSPVAKKYATKLNLRCEGIYNKAYELCYDELPDLETYCNTFLEKKGWWYPMRVLVCYFLRNIHLCDVAKSAGLGQNRCSDEDSMSSIVTPDFDNLLRQMGEDGRALGNQMTLSVYFKLIEQPRILRFRAVEGIQIKLKGSLDWLKDAVAVIRLLVSILFVLLVFNGMRNSFNFTHSYLTNIRFQNIFLTKYFWTIDERQPEESRLVKLYKFENKDNGLMSPWKPIPTSEDFQKMALALLKFLFFVVMVTAVLVMDDQLFRMMNLVDSLSDTKINQTGTSVLFSEVHGEGFMAKMVESMILTFNHSKSIEQNLTNDACDIKPAKLPNKFYWEMGLILGIVMFLIQVCLTFAIHRLKIFWIAGFIFPRRHKARLLFLYNRLVRERILFLKLRKGRIRQMIVERSLENERGFGIFKFFHQVPILNLCFGIECMICGDKVKPKTMMTCPRTSCSLNYCPECWSALDEQCYVCKVERGEATVTMLAPGQISTPGTTGSEPDEISVELHTPAQTCPESIGKKDVIPLQPSMLPEQRVESPAHSPNFRLDSASADQHGHPNNFQPLHFPEPRQY